MFKVFCTHPFAELFIPTSQMIREWS